MWLSLLFHNCLISAEHVEITDILAAVHKLGNMPFFL